MKGHELTVATQMVRKDKNAEKNQACRAERGLLSKAIRNSTTVASHQPTDTYTSVYSAVWH